MTATILKGLEPEPVWALFEEITRVPRPSTKEEKIRAWVKAWALKRGIPLREDETGNLLLAQGASPGCEDYPALVLQAHMDMVCQSAPGRDVDFGKEPVRIKVENGSIKAEGTTLGADNGIGMAYALALLAEEGMPHGPLEVLLTVNEETGFTGAFGLKGDFIAARYLLNLDSEVQGEITIGSAAGGKTEYMIPVSREKLSGHAAIRLSVSGLLSGHSGVQIHLPRLNAIKLILDGIAEAEKISPARVHSFEGGSAHNAIPAQASCAILVPEGAGTRIVEILDRWKRDAERKWRSHEPGMVIDIASAKRPLGNAEGGAGEGVSGRTEFAAYTNHQSASILSLLREIPHGPITWSGVIGGPSGAPGLVQTSNNLALIKSDGRQVQVSCLSRSSVAGELGELRGKLREIGETRDARVEQDSGYPGWTADPRSRFVQLVKASYETVVNEKVRLTAVHAGLECGLFTRLFPRLQMASIGPDIANAHSPEESVNIGSVEVLWRVLGEIMKRIWELRQ